jgi:hypothetical protein
MAEKNIGDDGGSTKEEQSFNLWIADVRDIPGTETSDTFTSCMSTLNNEEKRGIMRYKYLEDKKRALLSKLLQKTAIRTLIQCQEHEYMIERSREVCCHSIKIFMQHQCAHEPLIFKK